MKHRKTLIALVLVLVLGSVLCDRLGDFGTGIAIAVSSTGV